jgi:hypothetical protein
VQIWWVKNDIAAYRKSENDSYIYDRKRTYLRKKVQIWLVKNDTAAYRKSEIGVFFKKLRSLKSPQMLKSQKLHVSVYLRSNIPQTALDT